MQTAHKYVSRPTSTNLGHVTSVWVNIGSEAQAHYLKPVVGEMGLDTPWPTHSLAHWHSYLIESNYPPKKKKVGVGGGCVGVGCGVKNREGIT